MLLRNTWFKEAASFQVTSELFERKLYERYFVFFYDISRTKKKKTVTNA